MKKHLSDRLRPSALGKLVCGALFVYLFLGFMVIPCWNTLSSIFTATNSQGETDPLAVIRFFFAGNM